MQVSSTGGTSAAGSSSNGVADPATAAALRDALTASRKLNNLNIPNREFSVVRDQSSQRFVLKVIERSTGAVLDQFPAEDILRLLTQLSSTGTNEASNQAGTGANQAGETFE